MQRINALDPNTATGKTKELFNEVHNKLNSVPNMMRTMGNSPAVLNAYLSFNNALSESQIGARLGEKIALTVANANGCKYCNAAHSYIAGELVGIDAQTIQAAREGKAEDTRTQAALSFSRILLAQKGKVNDHDIESLKDAGFNDGEIAEIIAHTVLNIFTNYFNNAAGVEVDFPQEELVETALV
ncbi:carboxymuconolactone decarboxylase family protein [Aliifodinibius sp. S!AR15-10]|uniref:carboxymuconolactone decarboxylase family protein n=1 Tax=Aliifodinibius sp. S!AR15-10 TaxID=2950437 RepID=UPI00285AC114|nr:carboxymuconolactone decarboxylase family protein [Aliifodinibius sp. S!AR15-10]MDR8389559.1 carboxymuconolactone decarboxylase family protein [Aliifodinibius sp. S!AR15-10]